ncbi:ABC transporter permease [Aeromicrobium sp. CF4.19]|uniref:ABC transporter permease n=1 Tax=Aeromicrobium sp. CF4.19 TaxID=3373082 RepID=UPI003EE6E92F
MADHPTQTTTASTEGSSAGAPSERPERSRGPGRSAAPTFLTRDRLTRTGLTVTTLIGLVLIWWAVTAILDVDPILFPGPGSVWEAFLRANTTHPVAEGISREVRGEYNYFLWEHLIASLQRIGAGVGLAILVGIPLGLAMASFKWVGMIIDPYLNFLRSLPPLAYVGLLIVWFGIGDMSKIWLLFLAAFPPVTMATISGVRGVREDQINAVLSLGASKAQALRTVMLPATLPEIFTGVRVAVGFAWTTVVAAEILNGIPGIGGLAYLGGTQNRSALVIACIIVIGLTAILLDLGIKLLEKILIPWRGKA